MTTITLRPVKEAFKRAVDVYIDAMRPFLARRLKAVRGARADQLVERALQDWQVGEFRKRLANEDGKIEGALDFGYFPRIVSRLWWEAFTAAFDDDRSIQNSLWLINDARNKAEHHGSQDMDRDLASARLYEIAEMLRRVNAADAAAEVESIRIGLSAPPQPPLSADLTPQTPPDVTPPPQTRQRARSTASSLTPWREVISPSPDVSQGTFEEAEFVADLQQVYDGRAISNEYGSPVAFFEQTYITPGIETLLVNTLRRLAGRGGDPVIQTKTGFGGGKTHSLIALYHLVTSPDALLNPAGGGSKQVSADIRRIMEKAEIDADAPISARVSVLGGAYLAETDQDTTDSGDPLNTLWGVMAWQLGGQEAYDIIGAAAREGSAPGGNQLDRLFEHVGPCVILIDELVAYMRVARQLGSIYSFVQALTESARRNRRVALVVTLPESEVEAADDVGLEALERLSRLLGRIEAVWQPLELNEAFEVVRRRLFGRIRDETARDATCEAFSRMYGKSRRSYPREAGEQRYLDRMKECYPIHPEIFDRLYENWSTMPRFQRTRGALRMMASCISRLYLSNDRSPLIMPANLPLYDVALSGEFLRVLDSQWAAVITEADSDDSRTDRIDRNSDRFSRVGGAARRQARAIFLGSAPTGSVKGIDESRVRLGVVQPGHGAAVYNDARASMIGDLYYLYSSDGRCYFHVEENLNKVAADRVDQVEDRELADFIHSEMAEAVRGESNVVLFPRRSDDVAESENPRIVILPPDKPLPTRSGEDDDATAFALDILTNRGDAPRHRRNTLLFLAAKSDAIRALRTAARNKMAWRSISQGERRIENLQGERLSQANNKIRQTDSEMRSALVNAYRQTMAPSQPDPQDAARYTMTSRQISAAEDGNTVRNARESFVREEALVERISYDALAEMLDRFIWDNSRDHIAIDELWDFMTKHVYMMHRLADKSVLLACIEQGIPQEAFGTADRHDAANDDDPYPGLRFGDPLPGQPPATLRESVAGPLVSGATLLVSQEMAQIVKEEIQKRLEQERREREDDDDERPTTGATTPGPDSPQDDDDPTAETSRATQVIIRRNFDGDISLDAINDLRDEIIRTMRDGGGNITIAVKVSATHADGFADNTLRALRENAGALGLDIEVVRD